MVRDLNRNPNWKGGVCNITHVDELLDLPEYAANRKLFIQNNHVVVGECWNWTRSCFKVNGRARISIGIKSHVAARVCYVVFKNEPVGNLLVCHSCDNILCVNPDHLWLGTNADNSKDMADKGRTREQIGELNYSAKLTETMVKNIKKLLASNMKLKDIAKLYGTTSCNIAHIRDGRTWRHV